MQGHLFLHLLSQQDKAAPKNTHTVSVMQLAPCVRSALRSDWRAGESREGQLVKSRLTDLLQTACALTSQRPSIRV